MCLIHATEGQATRIIATDRSRQETIAKIPKHKALLISPTATTPAYLGAALCAFWHCKQVTHMLTGLSLLQQFLLIGMRPSEHALTHLDNIVVAHKDVHGLDVTMDDLSSM